NNWYWDDNILPKIRSKGSSPAQVQAIWVKTASKVDTVMVFPSQPEAIADRYEVLMGVLHDKFPNLKMVFVSGFFYGGYADTLKEFYDVVSEPGSYWNSFAVKWLVERQIMGDPDLKFTGPAKRSPFIAWGPYVWADGNNPNSEGLFWNCEADFAPDGGGYHLTNLGKDKEALLLLNWAKTNPVVKRWFLDNPKWNSCDPFGRTSDGRPHDADDINYNNIDQNIALYPSPNDGRFFIQWAKPAAGFKKLTIVNATGQIVFEDALSTAFAETGMQVDISNYPSGIYFATININGELFTAEFIRQ
ncbi:MAG: T9SS type A sorting domain-containing protein, partial [Chitinophagales bacterium]